MSRFTHWAKRVRRKLLRALGGRCRRCGRRRGLQFDCIIPQSARHHRCNYSIRATFWRQQFANGNLQLLCPRCHAQKTAQNRRARQERLDRISRIPLGPFPKAL